MNPGESNYWKDLKNTQESTRLPKNPEVDKLNAKAEIKNNEKEAIANVP